MSSPKCGPHPWTLTPFLYPRLVQCLRKRTHLPAKYVRVQSRTSISTIPSSRPSDLDIDPPVSDLPTSHLNPAPSDYSRRLFADRCGLVIQAGAGGHGCISFLRDKYISAGPANGGDGGSGGNVYIQAVARETSLHKLARRGVLRAGRGKNGQGRNKRGERGEDVLLEVPVGTVVRETNRWDPIFEGEKEKDGFGTRDINTQEDRQARQRLDKWILHPSSLPSERLTTAFPTLPGPRRTNLALYQPQAPIYLDLSRPMKKPILLAAGAIGGLGNPHFVSKSIPRPKFATKGEAGMRLDLDLELKILADVGLVGLPNAGKSTLLRALSRSKARVGNWAFTTLQPNIGTVVLDDYFGRPSVASSRRLKGEQPRTRFTVADIPGLIEDAHLDRGLGLGFLRHIERAQVLAFVVDLSRGNAVEVVLRLWNEIREYERLRGIQHRSSETDTGQEEMMMQQWNPLGTERVSEKETSKHAPITITSKPWFVIATKADLPNTQENFLDLRRYLESPSQEAGDWMKKQKKDHIETLAVSAIRGEGIERIVNYAVTLLD